MNTLDARYVTELTPEDYDKATTEVAFLLDAFASTIDNIMGGNIAPVGRIAGRDTAKKLPVDLKDASLEEIVDAIYNQMKAGFNFRLSGNAMEFSTCIIREMCAARKIETGGALCQLFHAYFDGIVNGLYYRPVKSMIVSTGKDTCSLTTTIQ